MVSFKSIASALAIWASYTQVALVEGKSLVPQATIAKVAGTLFDIDGVTQYFAGTNAYWIGFLTNNSDVDLVFTHLKAFGHKVLRVWGFNDITSSTYDVWYHSMIPGQATVINTGANGLQRLDYVVSSAEAHGVKVIINFVNNWSDYGGIAAYNTYFGGNASSWYTSSKIQAEYRNYVKAVISRYSSSTAVFAWELMNEPRCAGCATSVITNWVTSTSAYIKSLDPLHMVTIGDEGFMNGGGDGSYPYTASPGVDWVANLKIPTVDFGTFHLYPGLWKETNEWGNTWITNHAAECASVGKPCLLEEYGTSSNHVSVEQPWQKISLATKGMAGDMFWQFGDTLSSGRTANDTNTIYYGSSEWTSLVTDHVAAILSSTKTNYSNSEAYHYGVRRHWLGGPN